MFRHLFLAIASLTLLAPWSSAQGLQKKYALLIGIKRYDNSNFANLYYTENDVAELAKLLEPQGYQVTLLSDSTGTRDDKLQPTKANILSQLDRVLKLCQRNDLILVGFAGHGLQFKDEKASYFCPKDAAPNDSTTMVPLKTVYDKLEECGAGVKLMLVDACRVEVNKERFRGIDGDNTLTPPKGVSAFFSCSAGQAALELNDLRHGLFFHHFLEGMRGKAKGDEGVLSWLDLVSYTTRQVKRSGHGQIPVLKGEISDGPIAMPSLGPIAGKIRADFEAVDHLAWVGKSPLPALRSLVTTKLGAWVAAAELSIPEALHLVGLCELSGIGVAKNEEEAISRFERAANQGLAASQDILGESLYTGNGIGKDQAKAAYWFKKAAQQGYPHAQGRLGLFALYGMGGIIKSDANALRWFQRGAVNGDLASMYSLGFLFENGRGGAPKDDKQALEWFRLAGSHGYAEAKKYVADEVIVESFKHQGKFFRHEDWWLWVDPLTSKPEGASLSYFRKVPGLSDAKGVSFEAIQQPGHYLIHVDGRMALKKLENNDQKAAMTYFVRKGLASSKDGWMSLELASHPGHFMRGVGDTMWTGEKEDDAEYRANATFRFKPAPPIDLLMPPPADQISKAQAMRAIMDPYLPKSTAHHQKVHVVYLTPSDREPEKDYHVRLQRVMENISDYFAAQMKSYGLGPRTIKLDYGPDDELIIHAVKSKKPLQDFYCAKGAKDHDQKRNNMLDEARALMKAKGIDWEHEYLVVFANVMKSEANRFSGNVDTWFWSDHGRGHVLCYDYPFIDPLQLMNRDREILREGDDWKGSQATLLSADLALYCSTAALMAGVGGNGTNSADQPRGTSLQTTANSFRAELRRLNGGHYLSLLDAITLYSRGVMGGVPRDRDGSFRAVFRELQAEPADKSFVLKGRISTDVPCRAIFGFDEVDGNSWHQLTTVAIPDSQGRFAIHFKDLAPGKRHVVRLDGRTIHDRHYRQMFFFTTDKDGRPDVTGLRQPIFCSLQLHTHPTHYARHADWVGWTGEATNDHERWLSTLLLVPGLSDPALVSIQGIGLDWHYFRTEEGRIKLHGYEDTDQFRKDATFRKVAGLADKNAVSFESVSVPGAYLRHRNNELWVERGQGADFNASATFRIVDPLEKR